MGRVIVVDLAVGTWVDRIFDCDIYPIWVDDERLSLFDSCVSEQPDLYTTDLEPIGPGDDPGPAYGSRAVDETGAVFYPSSYAVGVVEPGAPEGVDLARLPTYPGEILVVPQEMRSRWVGSEFVPSPPGELDPVIDIATDGLPDVSLPDVASDARDGFDSPPWLMVLGSLLIAGALSVIVVVRGGPDRSG